MGPQKTAFIEQKKVATSKPRHRVECVRVVPRFPASSSVVNSSSDGRVPSPSSEEVGDQVSDDIVYDPNVIASKVGLRIFAFKSR